MTEDESDVQLAHKYRLSLSSPPRQSNFRVVAVLFYELDDSNGSGFSPVPATPTIECGRTGEVSRHHVVGTNDEPCYIGGSICAERAAIVQLRFVPNLRRISKLVISTDATSPVSPGMLCREFLASHRAVAWDMPIILASSKCRCCNLDISSAGENLPDMKNKLLEPCPENLSQHDWSPIRTTLLQLYPYPSPYVRLGSEEAVQMGERIVANRKNHSNDQLDSPARTKSKDSAAEQARSLVQMAVLALAGDSRNNLHPIQYGAAVLFSDGSTSTAYQKKELEYGCTLDAVTQLAPVLDTHRKNGILPVLLVQVDQYGIVHPPFAPARAFLTEHEYGNCHILVPRSTEETDDVKAVTASELAPSAPDMGDLCHS